MLAPLSYLESHLHISCLRKRLLKIRAISFPRYFFHIDSTITRNVEVFARYCGIYTDKLRSLTVQLMDYRTKRLESRYIAWPKIRTSRIKCKEEVGGRKIRTESCDEILGKLFFFSQERK